MSHTDRYHQWVEWSEADQTYLGVCPNLITGIHGDDPVQLSRELREVVAEVIDHSQAEGRTLPQPRVRSMQEVL